ncbi:11S globulin seed storage protein [Melia azedarach]|uniref:11S globulin seed storage protein n=1 Tax=Melia azedarach TaxID=155640 RepID=A0ACC1YG03_MELAZ|nr:11S globulin seed storage protein [Melia azedarach]
MANYSSLLSFGLGFLLLFHCCFAQIEQVTEGGGQKQQQQQQQRYQNKCQIQNLKALEPQQRIESEAGITELWDQNEEELQCANVAVLRHRIQQKGLLVPAYTNVPELVYVVQGRGIHGIVLPGCVETFQSEQSQSQQSRPERRSQDQHQKVRQVREGDIIALPTGVSHWFYNNGQSQLVLVALIDVGNSANQLDRNFRKFFLAGSPQQEFQGSSQSRSRSQKERESRGGNIFSGFDEQLLAEAFNVNPELIRRIQRQETERGIIVRVQEDLQVLSPQRQEEEQEYQERERWGSRDNGLEETLCTLKLRHNINDPSRADVYNPRAGRVTSVNSLNLPILQHLQLAAEKGALYRNAILAPHWNLNAHSIVYITRGSGRIQIVSESGDAVFNDQVQEGQLVVVPQNFAVVKRASSQGLEWISFKTSGFAMTNQLVGRNSMFRGLPEDVIVNSFQVSREDARRLKYNRQELTVFSPGSTSQRE